jgi:enamine deaminase RidA (YjgF/YER057c/UK114 family)
VPIHDRITSADGLAPGTGYSHAVVASGKLAFIAGQVAMDATGTLVGANDLRTQATQALSNIERILAALGADWGHVVRLGWYVLDAAQIQVIRDAREAVLRPVLGDQPNPASTLVQVSSLFRPEFLVEVDAVVALPD